MGRGSGESRAAAGAAPSNPRLRASGYSGEQRALAMAGQIMRRPDDPVLPGVRPVAASAPYTDARGRRLRLHATISSEQIPRFVAFAEIEEGGQTRFQELCRSGTITAFMMQLNRDMDRLAGVAGGWMNRTQFEDELRARTERPAATAQPVPLAV